MRPGIEERFAFFFCFGSEDPQHPPTGMSNLIRDETEEEPSGSSTLAAQEEGIISREKMFH
jgi:hypothetical protein